jgi:hypothetical protein
MAGAATAALIAGLLSVTSAAPAGAATPSDAQQWTDVQALVDPINGVWTDQNYSGQLSDTLPDTALIGNGDVGVSSGGGTGFKTFNFGKNDFWRGNPGPGAAGIGSVSIRPTGSTTTGTFREEQDILRGDITTTMSLGGVPVTMRTWIATDSNLVVTQLTSNGGAVQVRTDTTAGTAQNASGYTNTSGIVDQTAWATRTTPSGSRWVSRASLATRVIGATAATASSGRTASLTFTLPAGGTVRIVTAVAGGGQNPADPASAAWTLAGNQTAAGLDSLYSAHVDWWKQYWLKSYVDFNDSALERYYYGHLYLIGSASRAGKMAPGLYGPWITTDSPQFSGDMHLNYNWVANFYGVYSSNRPELARPMFDLVTQYLPEARRRAAQDLNRVKPDYISSRFPSGGLSGGGVLFPVGIGPWGSTPDDNYWQQVGNSLFTVTQYISYFDYTQDTAWLSSTGYPFMKEVGRFFEQYLELDSASGQYRLYTGPHEGTWARNSTADIGMLKSLFTSLVSSSTALGVDSGLRANWSNIASHLPAPATTTNNGQTVYALGDPGTFVGSDTRAFRPGDNTVNLEFVHPGEALSLSSPQADLSRAITTLDQMNSWGQDNSFPKVFTQAARVGYPAASLISQFKTQLTNKTAANLRVKDPNHGVEKAGAIEALNSMMLQTDGNGALRVFPVWPGGNNASFVKLRAEGALLVSSSRTGGTVDYVDVTATAARTVKLVSPWSGTNVTINRVGGGATSYTVSGSTISFSAAAGATYTVTFGGGGGGGGNGVTFYQDTNFAGTAVTLGVGSFSTAQMTAAGVPNNWVSSVRVPSGYTLTAYDGDLAGTSWVYTSDNANFVTTGNNDLVSSFRITASSGSTNLAIGATATASSSHPSFPPSRANNGQWASGYEGWVSNVGKLQWIQLDLGSAKTFSRYVIRHDAAARPSETANTTKNWTLEVSSNGTTWTVVDTVTNNTAATTDRTITSQTFRYVRVNISEPTQGTTSDSLNNPRARIGQIELY